MSEFKTNEKYDHSKEYVNDSLCISDERRLELINLINENNNEFYESELIDFVEQQDWSVIEKLYIINEISVIRFTNEINEYKDLIEDLKNITINLQKDNNFFRNWIENGGYHLEIVKEE